MIKSGFLSFEERLELESVVRCPSEDHGIARRCNALLLLDDGWSCERASKALYLDDDTIRTWYKKYAEGGFDLMASFDYKGGFSKLSASEEAVLVSWLDGRVCQNVHEVRAYIRDNWSTEYSKPGCIKLMHRLGFEYTRPQALPGHIDEQQQADFIENYEKLLNDLTPDEAVYFCDAVHPEHQSRPAHGWMRKGANIAIKRSSGRRRVNIHAAVNLENFDTPFMDVDRVDSDSTIQLFEKLEARNPDKKRIYLVLDNAPYHRASKVKHWLERKNCRIKPIWLPTYCPHLNAIERLWGVMHKHVTHNKFYPTFTEFGHAILKFLRETIPKNWKNFRDTVSDNFRIISNQNFRVME